MLHPALESHRDAFAGRDACVTGGAGFIGSHLVDYFLGTPFGFEVTVLDDFSSGSAANLASSGARLIEGSILDSRALQASMKDADAVVHLAARPSVPRSIDEPAPAHEVNATGTLRVLEAARGCGAPHVIVASSSSEIGRAHV